VRGHPDCHAKFIVADDRAALVSSANLDTNGLNNIGENGVLTTDLVEVDRIARFFARLWDGCRYEMPAGSAEYSVRERAATATATRCRVDVNPGTGIIWTHDSERVILEHLHDIIGRARHDLLLATYSLVDLAANPDLLLQPLEEVIRRHQPEVRLLCRGRNNVPSQRHDASVLTDLGVSIHADSVNHAKGAIADGRHGALFSANFDAAHGLLNGVETGVRLDGEPMLAEAVRFFGHAITHADLEFVRNPTQRDMDERLAAGWRTPWPGEARLPVRATDTAWGDFQSAAQKAPMLYTKEGDRILLHAGKAQWSLSLREDEATLEAAGSAERTTSELLETWLSSRQHKGPTRGFCPAVLERV
jgi:phosphatidylserine/phosphatidylglycerophosphate/cardiolipin synthase-like enzyme